MVLPEKNYRDDLTVLIVEEMVLPEKNYRDDLTILIVVTRILSLFPGLYDGFVEGYARATQKQDGYTQSAVPVTKNPIHLLTAALLHSTLYIHTPHSTLHALDWTLHCPHSPLHALHRTFPTQHCTFFTLHTLHSTPFHIPQSTAHWCCNREKWKTA